MLDNVIDIKMNEDNEQFKWDWVDWTGKGIMFLMVVGAGYYGWKYVNQYRSEVETAFIVAIVVFMLGIFLLGLKRFIRWLFSIDEILKKLDEVKEEI